MTRLSKWIAAWFLASGSTSAYAQQQTFACTKICWNRLAASAACSAKLTTQLQLTSYIWAVQHNQIAKGAGITFALNLQSKTETCDPPAISVVGYVEARNVVSFSLGALKVGDVIEIVGTGVDENQRNVMFYAAPPRR
jgi:hypothetical protein